MRSLIFTLCLLGVLVAEVQKAQITQSYSYNSKSGEFALEQNQNKVILSIHSQALQHFLNSNLGDSNIDSQSVFLNGGYTEFQNADKNFRTYVNSSSIKNKKQFYELIFELKEIDPSRFEVIGTQQVFPTMHCKFIVQKDLISFIDGRKDFVINLNNQHFFQKAIATKRFVQCLK
ncbi:hypothetical protein BBW65_01450 [Helicobacter enhydrae]|uniref:Uncharacterized protein n=1 Tax=Helicobacter enhydrae TaxID=222136 RepID=A0A1B1U466_9HELI|nr:hypothetical protein [Helicobacter enhydrae]ANV97553.1 hypothetical protein BBW65_01450 [Helicobacter enhydrae]